MNYWQTLELITRDWGMGHPLTDQFDREAIVQLIDEIGDTIEDDDQHWLMGWGLELDDDGDGNLVFHKHGQQFRVSPAPRGRLFVGGKLMQPKETFFTYAFYAQLKQKVTAWARDLDAAAKRTS
jgi:hypothetical protein